LKIFHFWNICVWSDCCQVSRHMYLCPEVTTSTHRKPNR